MISQEEIKSFLEGNDPEEHIVAIEYDYVSDHIYKIKEVPGKGKSIVRDSLIAFAWVGDLRGLNFYKGSKALQKEAMSKYGIVIDKLRTDGNERLENGLTFMVKSMKGYRSLTQFFRDGGIDPWAENVRDRFLMLPPVEQYLISKEKRLFKGFEEYNDITRFGFDLETTSLEPKDGRIFMIGMKTNKGFLKVIECKDEDDERRGLVEFFRTIDELKPSIISGYNSANFDWFWIFERCKALNLDIKKIAKSLNPKRTISQKESMLKLANEVEKFNQVQLWGYNIIDIIHSVRRAQAINSNIKEAGLKYITKFIDGEAKDRIYIDHTKIGPMYAEKDEYWLNIENGKYKKVGVDSKVDEVCFRRGDIYIKTTGDNIVERYLDDDLEETLIVDDEFNQGTFLLASLVPTTYERVSTMGTATLWKMVMLAWSYKHGLAIPEKKERRNFVGGLSRLLKVGYSKDVLKLDYSSLYPSIQLVHDVFPECDITGAMKGLLTFFRNSRIMYKNLASEYKGVDKKKSLSYDRKQLPIKIFINAFFGSLSAPQVFPWGDIDMGEQITCTGRQYLRQMLKFFEKRGYSPLVCDTDGMNFSLPDGGVDDRVYIGKGKNWLVKEGKEYRGYDADVAEFNDIFMRGEMGLDCDGTWDSCINLARKNYATMEQNGKIKLTGNSIKSKKMPKYIEKFLDKGVKQLLNGEGKDFIEWYYEYVQKIFDLRVPLAEIASKARVKLSTDDYIKRSKQTTKAGALMSRQAHMELIIRDGIQSNLGDTILYVNNGTKASHGDVQKVNQPKKGWSQEQIDLFFSDSLKSNLDYKQKEKFLLNNGWEKSWSEDNWVRSDAKNKEANNGIPTDFAYRLSSTDSVIQLNCYRIEPSDLENNPEMLGEYNIQRAITTFNKRVEPLLIVFDDEVRDTLLVKDPEDRSFYTTDQCKLINGKPFSPEDQDDIYENLIKMEQGEVDFWESVGIDPNYMYELAEPGWEEFI
jgi:DNA polymerase elongation subunit (family B)